MRYVVPVVCVSFLAVYGYAEERNEAGLPDSPGTVVAARKETGSGQGASRRSPRIAPKYETSIGEYETAQRLSPRDKVVLGLVHSVQPSELAGDVLGAGWNQAFDSRPHYGTDKGAFGQRLAAAAVKNVSQEIFTDSVYGNLFHEDTRYYVLGRGHSFFHRVVYAASRSLITRKDDGGLSANYANFAGNVSANALANAYYPQRDRSVGKTASASLRSLGTDMLGNEVAEFFSDLVRKFRQRN